MPILDEETEVLGTEITILNEQNKLKWCFKDVEIVEWI